MNQRPEVVIVGSGPGGAAAAWALCEAGVKVLLIEAGPRFLPGPDYRLDRSDWEQPFPVKRGSRGLHDVVTQQALDRVPPDLRSWNHITGLYVKGPRRASFGYHHVRGLGGSSLHFTGEAHRLNPRSMRMRSEFGIAQDWHLTYDELGPYWLGAERVVGVVGPANDRRCPRSNPYPYASHPLSYASQHMTASVARAGYGWQENSLAVLPRAADGRPGCNYCGGCLRGCQIGDKGSADVTYLRRAQQTGNLRILTETEVLRVETSAQRITGVVASSAGRRSFIPADQLILACGAIQTPRLLLNSEASHSPRGLANESGQVGRNFMETLLWTSTGLVAQDLGSHRGLPVDWVCWDFNAPDRIPGVIGGARFGPAQAESDLVGPSAYATRVVRGWGREHKKQMRSQFGRVLSIAGISESLPHPLSFVGLSQRKDDHGMPIPAIHSHIDDMAMARIRFMAKTCRDMLKACGVARPIEEFSSADAFSSTHVFGTCRMGNAADSSVVDRDCRSHRWPNLFIMDASVFPSSGGGESPGLTIQALALRASRKLLGKGNQTP